MAIVITCKAVKLRMRKLFQDAGYYGYERRAVSFLPRQVKRVFVLLSNVIMFLRALFVAIAGILTCFQKRSRGPRRRLRRKLWRRSRRNSRSIARPRSPRTQSSGKISTTTRQENDDSLPHLGGNEQDDELLSCITERPEHNEQTTFTSTAGGGISEKDGSVQNETIERLPELESWRLSLKVSDYFAETPESRPNADIPSSSISSAENEFTTSYQIQDSGFAKKSQTAGCSGNVDKDCSQTSEFETASEVDGWRLSLNISDFIPASCPETNISSSSKSSAFSLNTDIEEVGFTSQESSCSRIEDKDCRQTSETASEVECWRLSLNVSDYIPEIHEPPLEVNIPSSPNSLAENEFSPNTDIEEVEFVGDTSQESTASCSRIEDNDGSQLQTNEAASEVECWRLSLNISDYIPETPDSCPEATIPSSSKSSAENRFSPNTDIEEVGFVRGMNQESTASCSKIEDNNCSLTSEVVTEKETLSFKEELDIPHRLESRGVILEGVELTRNGSAVIGTILVRNECYEKRVAVRHTANDWQTFQDTSAQWMETVEGGTVDRFQFHLEIPDGEFSIKFAISFNEKWDNNEGKNYSLSCRVFNF